MWLLTCTEFIIQKTNVYIRVNVGRTYSKFCGDGRSYPMYDGTEAYGLEFLLLVSFRTPDSTLVSKYPSLGFLSSPDVTQGISSKLYNIHDITCGFINRYSSQGIGNVFEFSAVFSS